MAAARSGLVTARGSEGMQPDGSARVASALGSDPAPVDIVVPIYNAADDLARCVASVLEHTRGAYRLVLIDDASPEPAVAGYLDALAARNLPHVAILRNPANLGFIGTANRGLQLSRSDVVLLNSDTIVTAGWLEALARCAAANPSFGTITPFSNNAEICSFPRFCENNPWRDGDDPNAWADVLARAAVPTYPDLPTAVGFCMYVRRTLLDAIGVFDLVFGRGYGEENDFCLRGFAVGYRNVLCDDAFVLHLGGRSFVGEKAQLGPRNLAILLERHPHYVAMVQDYIARDPLRPIREAALARARADDRRRLGVLHVLHPHGGGTEQHVRSLVANASGCRHYLAVTAGERWRIEEHLDDGAVRTFDFARQAGESWPTFLEGVCGTFGIDLVHVHHLSGCREGLLEGIAAARVPYGFTAHDILLACPATTFLQPEGTYCGGETDPQRCAECLAGQAPFATVDVRDWRARHAAFVAGAAFVIAPSRWAARELARYFPAAPPVEVVPHGLPMPDASRAAGARTVVLIPDDDVPTVGVLGAIGPVKGARRLERLVELARGRRARLRFVLIGYLDREQGPWQSDDALFTIHGRYERNDLAALFAHYRVRLVLFPSAGPESFSYTLSEAWAAGRPALVPPIGALAERVAESGAGWVLTEPQWRDEACMLDALLARLAPEAEAALREAAARARSAPHATLAAMAQAAQTLYRRHAPGQRSALPVLAPVRVRDALGYRLWYPPIPTSPPTQTMSEPVSAAPPDGGAGTSVPWTARWRQSWIARRLRRVTPVPLRNVLRARLK